MYVQFHGSLDGELMRNACEQRPWWCWQPAPEPCFIPSEKVGPETELYKWPDLSVATAPLVCQLCGAGFMDQRSFQKHVLGKHHSYAEYRKRVLFLNVQEGPRALTAAEKRHVVQSYARHETCSMVGSGHTSWPAPSTLSSGIFPRQQAACAVCARLDWLEHRHEFKLFAAPARDAPIITASDSEDEREEAPSRGHTVSNRPSSIDATRVDKLLSARRYCERWPQIPEQEVFASGVRHPIFPEMIWLLHSRRIRLLPPDCDQDAASPVCAGTADPDATCLLCKECLLDLTAAKPRMPKFALANDFFLGRQHPAYRNLSDGMRWMLSLGRPVWRKVYLGSAAQETDEQQVGCASNCLLVAQPTAGMPEKILPPAPGEVEDSLLVAFTGRSGALETAKWAKCSRAQYLRCVRLRQKVCPTFADVALDTDRVFKELPPDGVPNAVTNCKSDLADVSEVRCRFDGPAASVQLQGQTVDDAESEASANSDADDGPPAQESRCLQETLVATDRSDE